MPQRVRKKHLLGKRVQRELFGKPLNRSIIDKTGYTVYLCVKYRTVDTAYPNNFTPHKLPLCSVLSSET